MRLRRLFRIDLAARARESSNRLSTALAVVSRFRSPPRPPALPRVSDAANGSRSLSRSSGSHLRRSSLLRRGRLARPPFPLSRGHPALAGSFFRVRGAHSRWRPRSTRPMSAAHGFSFQNDCPLVSAHSESHVPTRLGNPRFHADGLASANRLILARLVIPRAIVADVPLTPRRFAGSPAERKRPLAWPAGRRAGVLRVVPESLGLLRRGA